MRDDLLPGRTMPLGMESGGFATSWSLSYAASSGSYQHLISFLTPRLSDTSQLETLAQPPTPFFCLTLAGKLQMPQGPWAASMRPSLFSQNRHTLISK